MAQYDFQTFKEGIKKEIQEGGPIFPFNLSNDFLDWFIEKGVFLEISHINIPEEIKVKNSTSGNCFHNSQLVCLQNNDVPYFEGIMRGVTYKSITHHGFNLLNEKILDVTHINNKENFLEETRDETFYYFGVEIDNDYVKKFPETLKLKYFNNPIILKYYNDNLA